MSVGRAFVRGIISRTRADHWEGVRLPKVLGKEISPQYRLGQYKNQHGQHREK